MTGTEQTIAYVMAALALVAVVLSAFNRQIGVSILSAAVMLLVWIIASGEDAVQSAVQLIGAMIP